MLKKFFIAMLGSMAALWLSLGILVFGSIITIGLLIGKHAASSTSLKGDKILHLCLSGNIAERESDISLYDIITDYDSMGDDLSSMLNAIAKAKGDNTVKGIFIDCGGSSLGIASRTELIEAIKDFKESGKWVYAYADNYDQGDYYIATVADKVFVNPVGSVSVHGLMSQVMFYKDILDKIGVDVEVLRVGSFKSAVEPFMRMEMSPESRMQTEVYLNNIWINMKDIMAENLKVEADDIDMWADSLSFTWAPDRYVEQHAVTELRYRYEVEDMMRSMLKLGNNDEMPYISATEYSSTIETTPEKAHIAVLYAVGDIVDTGDEGISAETMVPEILSLAKDDNVKGLVLRVNSPGGSAFASEQIWKALEQFKAAGKPFYVSMGDYAASGGYYISCGADVIYADAATLTGSIGIFGLIPNAHELLIDKIGLGVEEVETNPNATFPSLINPMTAEQQQAMQSYIERGYDTFTGRVAMGRELPVDSVKAIGGGRVWDGASAKDLGLVDEIGSLATTVKAINGKLNNNYPVVAYPQSDTDLLITVLKGFNAEINVTIPGLTDNETTGLINYLGRLRNASPLQARMPIVIIR